MTFEEFFKKKRIDLDALEKVQPALFAEFKAHFEQMGEKSFDHTKKYWFNKLRGQYPLAIEVKTEKVKIENQLAEQTVTEAMIEEGLSKPIAPKLGFVPKFKAAPVSKPAEETREEETKSETTESTTPAPKLGFTPKFRAAAPPKPVEEAKQETTEPATPAAKLGFTPKFKANMPKPATEETPKAETPDKVEEATDETKPTSKLGFTPKFKAANISTQVVEDKPGIEETAKTEESDSEIPAEPKAAQLYKPRFNMKNIPPKKEGE